MSNNSLIPYLHPTNSTLLVSGMGGDVIKTIQMYTQIFFPVLYYIFEVILVIGILISVALIFPISKKYPLIFFTIIVNILIWGLLYLAIYIYRSRTGLLGSSLLEILNLNDHGIPISVAYIVFSSPLIVNLFVLILEKSNLPNADPGKSIDIILGLMTFSIGLLLVLVGESFYVLKNFSTKFQENTIKGVLSNMLKTQGNHIGIGGYGSIGSKIAERLLQLYYSKKTSSSRNLYGKWEWIWTYEGEFSLKKLTYNIVLIDNAYEKWDYRIDHPSLFSIGLEYLNPIYGDVPLVPIVGSNLMSEYTWKVLHLTQAMSIVQTFKDETIENYLLQKNPERAKVAIRSSTPSLYVDTILRSQENSQLFAFYPPMEIGALVRRELALAIADVKNEGRSCCIIFLGEGEGIVFSVLNCIDILSFYSDIDNIDTNIIVITNDESILQSCRNINRNQDSLLNENLNVVEWELPSFSQNLRNTRVSVIKTEPTFQIVQRILKSLRNATQNIVPIFVVIGKEGSSEKIAIDIFRAISQIIEKDSNLYYYIVLPYFFPGEVRRLLESAIVFNIDITKIRLFEPYQTIQEGVSNFVRW